MSLQEIQKIVRLRLASEAGQAKVNGRRKAMAKLARGLENPKLAKLRLRSRNAWFSTTQGDATSGKGAIRVQLYGEEIAHLELDKESHYQFYPKDSFLSKLPDNRIYTKVIPWAWSHDRGSAASINKFLKSAAEYLSGHADAERELQWELAKFLGVRKSPELKNYRVVTWNGLFAEVGVSIKSNGLLAKKAGNIDLVVRRGKGTHHSYLVFELKKPGITDFEKTLHQAVRYATSLLIEANRGVPEDQKNYHKVFGSTDIRKLKIGAVVVMEDHEKTRDAALAYLQRCWDELD